MSFKIDRTKSGVPCLWEEGGGMSNTGHATVIAGPTGRPKVPVYVRRAGQLAVGQHALIPVGKGDLVVSATHHRRDFNVAVYSIDRDPGPDETLVQLTQVALFDRGEWSGSETKDGKLNDELTDAVTAATQKATCYHCREPHWVAVPKE